MFIEPTITRVSSGFSGYIWLHTKVVFEKILIPTCECRRRTTDQNRTFASCPRCRPQCCPGQRNITEKYSEREDIDLYELVPVVREKFEISMGGSSPDILAPTNTSCRR